MISNILGQVTGVLDRRFLLNAFFPALAFSIAAGLVVGAGSGGVTDGFNAWNKAADVVKVSVVVATVATVFVVANVVANNALGIVRVFEGYAPPASWAASWGRRYWHYRAAKALTEITSATAKSVAAGESLAAEFQQQFPVWPRSLSADDLAPTRLGNLLRSAETYPFDRYGADATRLWPRLYTLLPDPLRTSMDEARAAMEFPLVVAMLAAVYAPAASLYLIIAAGPLPWFLGSLLGGTAIALVAYRASLAPAAVYGMYVRISFDLHRFRLLEAARFPIPATIEEERRTWGLATRMFELGQAPIWRYVKASE